MSQKPINKTKNKKTINSFHHKNFLKLSKNGEGGIRTPGTLLRYTVFPGLHLKPLGHFSSVLYSSLSSNQNRSISNILSYKSTFQHKHALIQFHKPLPPLHRPLFLNFHHRHGHKQAPLPS